MDPNEARRRLDELLTRSLSPFTPSESEEIAELWQALDSWLRSGGFLPAEWER